MGANREQGWSLLLFVIGFTFLVAGLAALGAIFWIGGLACLLASAIWCYRIKPLEHLDTETTPEPAVTGPSASEEHRAFSAARR
jgi:membrane-bound ClpP family serine protease